jgi:molybdopterin synthase sulfur carrier subunit
MPRVLFTGHLSRYIDASSVEVPGATVAEALAHVFAQKDRLRPYILDEQGHLRRHVSIYVGGAAIADRASLNDPVGPADEIYILQALSGG